jgi:glycosyltransferase involved in cell wall biosynthesis
MPHPLVTTIIPCHNHEQWICDAITSVATQDYPNARIVLVDDGSTDGSVDRAVGLIENPRYPKPQPDIWTAWGNIRGTRVPLMIQKLPQANGPSFARNWGIQVAWEGTDIFGFLDSDDMFRQGKLSKSVAKMLQVPSHIGGVYSDYDTLRPDGLMLRQFKEPFSRERMLGGECVANMDSIVSKKAIEACGAFDPALRCCEDFDFWMRISERFVICHLPESLVTIRVGEHSSSTTVPTDTWQRCYSRVFEKVRERAN